MLKVPFYKQILSYIYPVRIRKSSGKDNSLLELCLYKGQYQLGTTDALYSDGRRYRPVLLAVDKIGHKLSGVKSVLALGAGIGSVIQVLSDKGYHPQYTLVDIDNTVLQWAKDVLDDTGEDIKTICTDADEFMERNKDSFDMLLVDVFNGMVVPFFVTTEAFLQKCRQALKPGGPFVKNYMVYDRKEWQEALKIIGHYFPQYEVHLLDGNRIVIASV
jgi:spermidine synthase